MHKLSLNEFLDGGLPLHRVTELRGDTLCGKTLFSLNIVLDLIKQDKKVIYIDTDYGLCSNTFLELVQEQIKDEDTISELMRKVDICFLNSYQELVFKLDKLYINQKNGQTGYDLLIIDSIISPLTTECLNLKKGAKREEMREKINLFIELINKLLTASITVLTINTPSNYQLPKSWTNRCDLILQLNKDKLANSEYIFNLRTRKSFKCLHNLSNKQKSLGDHQSYRDTQDSLIENITQNCLLNSNSQTNLFDNLSLEIAGSTGDSNLNAAASNNVNLSNDNPIFNSSQELIGQSNETAINTFNSPFLDNIVFNFTFNDKGLIVK